MVGYGAAIDPPREVVEAVAPVSGKMLKLMPHAYVVMTADNVGVLVHLGLDTVALNGEGFTTHVSQGDDVFRGPGRDHLRRPSQSRPRGSIPLSPLSSWTNVNPTTSFRPMRSTRGAEIASGADLFTANK